MSIFFKIYRKFPWTKTYKTQKWMSQLWLNPDKADDCLVDHMEPSNRKLIKSIMIYLSEQVKKEREKAFLYGCRDFFSGSDSSVTEYTCKSTDININDSLNDFINTHNQLRRNNKWDSYIL